jgi:Zn finger protein HypA/HybF involved in hydrogenase expression
MADILSFKENTPHSEGKARCLLCGYEFVLVAPIEGIWFECPKCKVEKAVFKFPMEVTETKHWQCNCGNFLFYVTPEYIYCPNCGSRKYEWHLK